MTDAAPPADPGPSTEPAKRGRGRPPGSKNRPRGRDFNDVLREDGPEAVRAALTNAELYDTTLALAGPAPDGQDDEPPHAGVDDTAEPSDMRQDGVDADVVAACAKLDQSDTDNGTRLLQHFGRDMLVVETENVASADWVTWAGDHWDAATGNDGALRYAQRVGGRIALEADYLAHTPKELIVLSMADHLGKSNPDTLSAADRATLDRAKGITAALDRRRSSRRAFGVTSKNQARIVNMLRMAAPHSTRKPDAFNADPLLTAVEGHTLRFVRDTSTVRERDPECPDPDVERYVEREVVTACVEAISGHDRAHLITKLLPVRYDPAAACPRWTAFLEEYQPDPELRRMVQVYSGLGITGVTLQKVVYHHGSGANGKSVFMETLMRLCGPLGADLPAASLTGDNRSTGAGASPDLAMLQGARIVRVAELPANEPVKEELSKLLTGGERMPVRNLFKGFFRFTPVFKAHLSGNGLPRIDGTDEGIWRRMCVATWPREVPVEKRRELNEVVNEFVAEGPGILNWLIEGVLIFLREGFIVPEAARAATQHYRDEMDPVGQFKTECVAPSPSRNVQATDLYEAYVSWSMANAKVPKNATAFGKIMKLKMAWKKASVMIYTDCRLHSVPDRPRTDTGFVEER